MKSPSTKRILSLVIAGLLTIATISENKILAADSDSPDEQESPALPATSRQAMLAWNMKTLVQAYEQANHTNISWDKPAILALTEFARMRARVVETNEQPAKIIRTNSTDAVAAGCDDPMIKYLYLRYSLKKTDNEETVAIAFVKLEQNINQSTYPSVRKFYVDAMALARINLIKTNKSLVLQLKSQTMPLLIGHLEATLRDKTTPAREAYDVADRTLSLMDKDKINYQNAYVWIKPLFDNWPDDYTTWLLKGKANIHMAWDARGSDWADTVTDKGWKLFGERIDLAQQALEHAWLLNPKDPEIIHEMMTVELGQGSSRDKMELWFDRAMKLNPNDYAACHQKLYYLEPKWYGSDQDQLEFGRWCVLSKKWGGSVPLILFDARVGIASRLDASEQANYWKQPEVWSDIQSSFDRFFELNPDAISKYHTYALYAYKAEQWDKLNEIIPKLGTVHYEYFGGKAEFDKMVALAKNHSISQKN